MSRWFAITALCLTFLASVSARAADNDLVAKMATEHVDITARFTGQELLIFGAFARPGEVIVKVTSPEQPLNLTHKARFGLFWLTAGKVAVDKAPGLVYVLSSAPLDQMLDDATRRRYGLEPTTALDSAVVRGKTVPPTMGDWRSALLHLKRKHGYYLFDPNGVSKENNRLFFTRVRLPAKLPLGSYRLDTYLVQDGQVIAHHERDFDVREVKLERWVSTVAYQHSWAFGIGFTLFAMFLGLGLGIALRRNSES